MARKRAQKSEITGGKILHRLYDTEIYQQMVQANVPKGEETNHNLIKELLNRQDVINTILLFLQGQADLGKAIDDFRAKISPKTKRFEHIQRVTEQLFYTLANTIKSILNLQGEVTEKVEEILKENPEEKQQEAIELEVGETIDLKKEKPVKIKGGVLFEIVIVRGEDKENHILKIKQNLGSLVIGCSTPDSELGKGLMIAAKQGDEYAIGMPNGFLLRRAKSALEREKALYKKADREYKSHELRCTVSEETITSKARVDELKLTKAAAEALVEKLENNPLRLWFDQEKSADISQDHIIVELTEDNEVVITDDGEECTSTLTRVK